MGKESHGQDRWLDGLVWSGIIMDESYEMWVLLNGFVGGWRGRDDGGCKESGGVKCEGEQKEDTMKML